MAGPDDEEVEGDHSEQGYRSMDKFLLWSWIGAALAAVGVGLLVRWRRPATTQEEDKDRLRTEYFRQKRETKQLRGPEIDDQLDFCGPCQYLRLRHASSPPLGRPG